MLTPIRGALAALIILSLAILLPAETPPASGDPQARIAALRTEIARHDELYFKRAAPEITDAEYDALKRDLRALEAQFPDARPAAAEVVAAVGDDRSGAFPTYRHRVPMRSLAKSHAEADLRRFFERVARGLGSAEIDFVVEPKYDGLAISVTYERGRLVRAVTRGDGLEGDVVTENLLACSALPRALTDRGGAPSWPDLVEVRGEVFMTQAEFERLNAERVAAGQEPFAHPRNLAVGTLKSTDAAERDGRRLEVVFYGWGAWEPTDTAPDSQRQLLEKLAAWGLPVPEWVRGAHGPAAVGREVRAIERARTGLGFPIDGAVVKVDAVALRRTLGESEVGPAWAVAYKFEPERVETVLKAITLQIGRMGTVTPVAELEPVTIGGSTVARASLHNAREIARRDYRVGDTVKLEKAGEIIPVLVGVVSERRSAESRPFEFPAVCPVCATALVEDGSAGWRCPNRACPAQVKRRLEHFVSAAALNLRGFGPAAVEALVEQGSVKELDDLYRVSGEQLLAATGGKPKVADKLAAEIERSRKAERWRVIHGLSLPEAGAANARKLARHFATLAALRDATVEQLRAAGLAKAAAEALATELRRPEVRALLTRLDAMLARE